MKELGGSKKRLLRIEEKQEERLKIKNREISQEKFLRIKEKRRKFSRENFLIWREKKLLESRKGKEKARKSVKLC